MTKDSGAIADSLQSSSGAKHCTSSRRTVWAGDCFAGIVLVTSLLLFGCSTQKDTEETPTVAVQVGAAENQTIQLKVIADAVLYPRDQAAIAPKISAPVRKFYVERGSKVHEGQLLAELENQDLAGTVTENLGGYQQAEAAYQSQVQKAQEDQKLAKEVLDAQQRVYDSRQVLHKEGAASAKDVDDAAVSLTQARNQYEVAQKQLELKGAEGQLTAAQGRSENAAAQLRYSKILSPISGVVTDRPIYPGEMASSGTPIITVMDLSQVVARAHIPLDQAGPLKVGNAATLSTQDGLAEIPGKVILVSPALDPNSATVEVWVQAANPKARLKPGNSIQVTIVSETIRHAIVAPATALLTASHGATSVIVLDSDNKPSRQQVKVGIRDGDHVQIAEGLKGGERVVTVGAFELDKEDADVLAKTKIQVQAPNMPEEKEGEEH
jgi:HlyD family secretion protein